MFQDLTPLFLKSPRSRKETLIDWRMFVTAYGFLGILEAVAAMSAFFFVLIHGGWHYGQPLSSHELLYLQATTACLSAIILMQIANVFICKQPQRSLLSARLLDNRLILWGIAAEIALILAIVYTPWGNALFGTAPIDWEPWLFTLPFVVGMLLVAELRKWLVRRYEFFPAQNEALRLRGGHGGRK